MRIATFNILHGRSTDDGRVDVERFGNAVASLDADVLGLQEVDRHQPRSGGADLTAVAAQALGASEHRFAAALSGTPGGVWTPASGTEPPGDPAYGIALLSRHPVRSWRVVRLPALGTPVLLWSGTTHRPFLARDEPRVALVAVVDSPTGAVTVCTTHLSFVPGWNGRQLRRLVRELTSAQEPLVVTGDLNMRARSAVRITGMRSIATADTFPAHRPTRQIDHVLVRGHVRADGPGRARELPLSDHRALVVECEPG